MMKRKWRMRDRIPGLVLIAGLGFAGLLITVTNTVLPLPHHEQEQVQAIGQNPSSNAAADAQNGSQDAYSENLPEGLSDEGRAPAADAGPAPAIERVEQGPTGFRTTLVENAPAGTPEAPKVADAESFAPNSKCVQVSYRHKAVPGHPDRERCAAHKNVIRMGTKQELAGVNWSSVCLRVDGVVTAYDRVPEGVVFGPFAGPDSKVTLSYCRGKAVCSGGCEPPRDLFLEAIGATLKRDKKAPALAAAKGKGWDPSETEDDVNPTAVLELELQEIAASDQPSKGSSSKVFKDWSAISKASGCEQSLAAKSN